MRDTADSPGPDSRDQSKSEEGAASEGATTHDDRAAADHRTGQKQAAENEDRELPG